MQSPPRHAVRQEKAERRAFQLRIAGMNQSSANFISASSRSTPPRERYAALPALYLINPFQAVAITTEAMIRRGLPVFQISGLSPAREIGDRIRSALLSCDAPGLRSGANIQVNLAPVDLRKSGAYLDLSIAVSILQAFAAAAELAGSAGLDPADQQPARAEAPNGDTVYLGELSLDGRLLPVPRLPALLRESRRLGFRRAIVPASQLSEARLIRGIGVVGVESLAELMSGAASEPGVSLKTSAAAGTRRAERPPEAKGRPSADPVRLRLRGVAPPLSPLLDQLELDPGARRALAIAAAGWHSLILIGPPGTGKSSMARQLAPLLAPPDENECLEILIGGESRPEAASPDGLVEIARPVRAPHHSCTRSAMIGGGAPLAPGEITRAHHGVLLLDELAEFSRDTLQSLREPLENATVRLSRGRESACFPARFLLVATTNPCPCGRQRLGRCECGPYEIRQYMNRILGPLRDRIDLEVRVEGASEGDERIAGDELQRSVRAARFRQRARFVGTAIAWNGEIPAAELERYVPFTLEESRAEWREFVQSKRHSHRSLAGIRRVARTIADLEDSAEIRATDLQEALYYRCLDRYWS